MIAAYNTSKLIRGVVCVCASLVCFALAWLFFRYSATWILDSFRVSTSWAPWLAVGALAGVCLSGHATWKRGQGFQSYVESALYHNLPGGADTAGANVVDHYAHRVTGPAYVLGQVFLGGPILLLKGIAHLRQRLPNEAGLETRLHHALGILRAANKWQPITEHPALRREILLLAQMKQIDFSAYKGIPRCKASPPNGI